MIAKLCDHLLLGDDPTKWVWINLRTALYASLGFVLTGRWAELSDLLIRTPNLEKLGNEDMVQVPCNHGVTFEKCLNMDD